MSKSSATSAARRDRPLRSAVVVAATTPANAGRGDEARVVAYISMIFAYLKMALVVGGLAEQELRAATPAIFTNPRTRAFWAAARSTYLADDSSAASRTGDRPSE
ncbi:DUF6082 family protein [Asanoa ferruginea]|uniref:DUF6082 family protein n=1 Tax=Asanoa ferruginea TaxID=53367 RepID=UPI0039088BE8